MEAPPESRTLFLFRCSGETFAVPAPSVFEVIGGARPTELPFAPDWIRGILNIRGAIVPVLDLLRYFQLSPEECRAGRVVLLKIDGVTLGVFSDRIVGLQEIGAVHLEHPPNHLPGALSECIVELFRQGDELVYFLDPQILCQASHDQTGERQGSLP